MHLICPQKLRTIFVGERYSPNAAPGPSNEGAAAMMGNTVSTWEKVRAAVASHAPQCRATPNTCAPPYFAPQQVLPRSAPHPTQPERRETIAVQVYDRTRHLRNIQQAADGMDEWRSALLARGKAGWQGAGEAAPGEEAATRGPLDSPALQAPRSAGTSKSAKRQKVCSGAESEDWDDTEAGSDAGTYWSAVSVSGSEVEQPKQVCRGGGLQQLMWEVMESRK